jgi:transcriptional regulator with XRE-family HTH domain
MPKSIHTPEYAALRDLLRKVRHEAGLSQRDLAGRMAVPRSWVANVETGERRIDLIEFAWFVRACGCDVSEAFAEVVQHVHAAKVRIGRKRGRP